MVNYTTYKELYGAHEAAGLITTTGRPSAPNKYLIPLYFNETPAVGKRYYFTPFNDLKKVRGIRAITNGQTTSIKKNGTTYNVPTADGYKDAVLYLLDERQNVCAAIPLNVLTAEANDGKPVYFNTPVEWRSCFVEFNSNTASLTTSNLFLFEISA